MWAFTHSVSPVERAALLAAERDGQAFLAYRDGLGDLRLLPIEDMERVTIGRATDNDVVLDADPQVSRSHAVLDHIGGGWAVRDDGLSRGRPSARSNHCPHQIWADACLP